NQPKRPRLESREINDEANRAGTASINVGEQASKSQGDAPSAEGVEERASQNNSSNVTPAASGGEQAPRLGLLAMSAFVIAGMAASGASEGAEEAALLNEIEQLDSYGVFEKVDVKKLTEQQILKAIPTVMLITDKFGADGVFLKVKARFVIK